MKRMSLAGLGSLIALSMAVTAHAGDVHWILGGSGTGSYQAGANWSPATPPGASDRAVFDLPGAAVNPNQVSVTLANSVTNQETVVRQDLYLKLSGFNYATGDMSINGPGVFNVWGAGNLTGNQLQVGLDSTHRGIMATSSAKINMNSVVINGPTGLGVVGSRLTVTTGGSLTTPLAQVLRGSLSANLANSTLNVSTLNIGDVTDTNFLGGGGVGVDNGGRLNATNITLVKNGSLSIGDATMHFTSLDSAGSVKFQTAAIIVSDNADANAIDVLVRAGSSIYFNGTTSLKNLSNFGSFSTGPFTPGNFTGNVTNEAGGSVSLAGAAFHGLFEMRSGSTFAQSAGTLDNVNWRGGATDVVTLTSTTANQLNLTGALQLFGSAADPLLLDLKATSIEGHHSYVIAQAAGGISGFDPNAFAFKVNGSAPSPNQSFSVSRVGNTLVLDASFAVPEPSSLLLSLLAAGGVSIVAYRARRRR